MSSVDDREILVFSPLVVHAGSDSEAEAEAEEEEKEVKRLHKEQVKTYADTDFDFSSMATPADTADAVCLLYLIRL